MRLPRRQSLRVLGAGFLAAAAGTGVLLAGLAGAATDTKPFTATIAATPDAGQVNGADVWAGTEPTITITIQNDANPQTLGSANITIPAGITNVALAAPVDPRVTLQGNVIQLRNLNLAPAASVSVGLTARIPCAPATAGYAWPIAVKQSNDFNGTGNDFTPNPATTYPPRLFGSGLCSLRFTADGQPTSAQKSSPITGEVFLPTSTRPVTVRIADGSGNGTVTWWSAPVATPIVLTIAPGFNPGSGTIGGITSVTPVAGVAQFIAPTIDKSANGYKLTASATPPPSGDTITGSAPLSNAFSIVDSGQRCTPGAAKCTGNTSNGKVSATVSATATNQDDLLLLSVGAADAPVYSCAGYTASTDTLAFDFTTITGATTGSAKTVLYRILNPTKPASKYEMCFRSPSPFKAKAGSSLVTTTAGTDGFHVGLLPTCRQVSSVPPCVADSRNDSGTVLFTVTAPAGDPWLRG